jgi:hypothetical protein
VAEGAEVIAVVIPGRREAANPESRAKELPIEIPGLRFQRIPE